MESIRIKDSVIRWDHVKPSTEVVMSLLEEISYIRE